MNRRDVIKASAVAVALPVLSVGEPAAKPAFQPQVFSAAQNETVIALTEAILPATDTPGAKAAKVNEYIDRFLAVGPINEKDRFLQGLAAVDNYAQQRFQQPFTKLSAGQQNQLLQALDAGTDASLADGHRFFRMAKQMTARIYYQTEIGYNELNKGGSPGGFGCQHGAGSHA